MNYTIYIRKQNWQLFENEDKKAELINKLLTNHYKATPYDNMPKVLNFEEPEDRGTTLDIPPEAKTDSSFNPERAAIKKGVNLCKVHNLPLTVYGKCLQKGCKNA